ncbi:unnamed protein product [Leptosia nina]|uniref:Uncharacterized protein n=1 Tax=Leptosia nina TaxID=320188 RepID=A0AAV1JVB4_9NEOP
MKQQKKKSCILFLKCSFFQESGCADSGSYTRDPCVHCWNWKHENEHGCPTGCLAVSSLPTTRLTGYLYRTLRGTPRRPRTCSIATQHREWRCWTPPNLHRQLQRRSQATKLLPS